MNEILIDMKAKLIFFLESTKFILLPIIAVNLILVLFPAVTTDIIADKLWVLIVFGGVISAMASIRECLPKSSIGNMLLGVGVVLLIGAWYLLLLGGEKFLVHVGQITIGIDPAGFILLIFAAALVKMLVPIAQFLSLHNDHRSNWRGRATS